MGRDSGSGYQVSIKKIRTAAKGVQDVADHASGVDVTGALDYEVPNAMPGSICISAAADLANHWQRLLCKWVDQAGEFAESLRQSADAYADSDEAARRDLQTTYYEIGPN